MKTFFDILYSVEKILSEERGHFNFFAVFLREDSNDKWDVLLSASWLSMENINDLKYISNVLKSRLGNDYNMLSKIVIIEKKDPFLDLMYSAINIEHGRVEFYDCRFSNIFVKHALIITSRKQ
jgi:hypothetical protein